MKAIYKISIIGILLALGFLTSGAAADPYWVCPYCGAIFNHACIPFFT